MIASLSLSPSVPLLISIIIINPQKKVLLNFCKNELFFISLIFYNELLIIRWHQFYSFVSHLFFPQMVESSAPATAQNSLLGSPEAAFQRTQYHSFHLFLFLFFVFVYESMGIGSVRLSVFTTARVLK